MLSSANNLTERAIGLVYRFRSLCDITRLFEFFFRRVLITSTIIMANYLTLITISKNDLISFLFQQLIMTHSLKNSADRFVRHFEH